MATQSDEHSVANRPLFVSESRQHFGASNGRVACSFPPLQQRYRSHSPCHVGIGVIIGLRPTLTTTLAISALGSSYTTLLARTTFLNSTQPPPMPSRKRNAISRRRTPKPTHGFASVSLSLLSVSWPSLPSSLWRALNPCGRMESSRKSASGATDMRFH